MLYFNFDLNRSEFWFVLKSIPSPNRQINPCLLLWNVVKWLLPTFEFGSGFVSSANAVWFSLMKLNIAPSPKYIKPY